MRKDIRHRKKEMSFIILVILWTAFIWHNSMCPATESSVQSGRVEEFLLPILNFLCIPEAMRQFLVRKAAHLTEFAVLGFLWSGALQGKRFCHPLVLSIFTAIVDEGIQRFVPGRSGEIEDVLIDTAGVIAALVFLWIVKGAMSRWKRKSKRESGVPDEEKI